MPDIILASTSPRRKMLFEDEGLSFKIVKPQDDEVLDITLPIPLAIQQIAFRKIEALIPMYQDSLLVGCDTVVVCDGKVLGKPKDRKDAISMLQQLSDNQHIVVSAVAMNFYGRAHTFYEETTIDFHDLSDEEIETYVDTKQPFDKAGSYGIQEVGDDFIAHIQGDFNNVIGFPMEKFLSEAIRIYGEGVFDSDTDEGRKRIKKADEGKLLSLNREVIDILNALRLEAFMDDNKEDVLYYSNKLKEANRFFENGKYHEDSIDLELATYLEDKEMEKETYLKLIACIDTLTGFMKSKLYKNMEYSDVDPTEYAETVLNDFESMLLMQDISDNDKQEYQEAINKKRKQLALKN